jgi:hypothetical protein
MPLVRVKNDDPRDVIIVEEGVAGTERTENNEP